MAGAYLPTTAEEANRQQLVSSFFWTAANLLDGTDTVLRVDPGAIRADGAMGAPGSAVSYGVGPDGRLYVRGASGSNGAAEVNAPALPFALTPGLLLLAGLLFVAIKA